jgi:hypothetical protein
MPLASCKRFGDFMPHIRDMRDRYGVTNVFVTSDSTSVYDEIAEFGHEGTASAYSPPSSCLSPRVWRRPHGHARTFGTGFTFIHSREDRDFLHHDWLLEMRLRMALVDRKQAPARLTPGPPGPSSLQRTLVRHVACHVALS